MQKYTEIKIFPDSYYGYSVEDYRKDVGVDGITIESFDSNKGEKENVQYICMDRQVAVEVAKAILQLCEQ